MKIPPQLTDDKADALPPPKKTPLEIFWERFNARFPRELDCMDELFRMARKYGAVKCPRCCHTEVSKAYGDRLVRCKRCRKQWSFTANTFFHRIRRARPWLAAIRLMEHRISVSSGTFENLADIAYSSAWTTLQKVAAAIESEMSTLCHQVPSSVFSELFLKRSRETPARAHPLAEQEEIDRHAQNEAASRSSDSGQADLLDFSPDGPNPREETNSSQPGSALPTAPAPQETDCLGLGSGHGKQVYEFLSMEPIHFDVLHAQAGMSAGELSASLTLLEMDGVVVRMPGDWYVRATPDQAKGSHCQSIEDSSVQQSAETAIEVGGIRYSVRRTYHGISRKYLQPYLARYWCQTDRSRWSPGAVMEACFRFGPISYSEILAYVSPATVKVFACS